MIQKKKFSDAIAANISVVGGLLPVANNTKNGLAIKGTMNMDISLNSSTERRFKPNYGLIFVGSVYYAVGCVFLFSNSIIKIAGIGIDYFSTSDEPDKICLIYKDNEIILKDNKNTSDQLRPFNISFLQGLSD